MPAAFALASPHITHTQKRAAESPVKRTSAVSLSVFILDASDETRYTHSVKAQGKRPTPLCFPGIPCRFRRGLLSYGPSPSKERGDNMHLSVSDYIALAALIVAIIEAVIHYCEYKKK